MRFWKKKHKHHHHHHRNIIPLSQAIAETQQWREHYAKELSGIKAFFIPMHDLKRLVKGYKKCGATGARAYLGLVMPLLPGNNTIRMILVPANEKEDFYDAGPGAQSVDDGSSVYDFTMPCPDTCAGKNPLNSD